MDGEAWTGLVEIALADGRYLVTAVPQDCIEAGRELLAELAVAAVGVAPRETLQTSAACVPIALRGRKRFVFAGEHDAFGNVTDAFASASRVHAAQALIREATGIAPSPPAPTDFATFIGDLQAVSLLGTRQADEAPFTGWMIVRIAENGMEGRPRGIYTIEELRRVRAALLPALGLPVGWSFKLIGSSLWSVTSPAEKRARSPG